MSRPVLRRIDEDGGAWVRLQLDAPPGHILSSEMVDELTRALESTRRPPGLRWLTLEGSGGEFSYGASIPEHLPAADAARCCRRCTA